MFNSNQRYKKSKKKTIILIITSVIVGCFLLSGIQWGMHYTSKTEFCISCHTMQIPFEEYQGSKHYSNAKGIRAECADCHIPNDTVGYLITKIRASKDVYHQFITKKISTEEKYESHRQEMAETVWAQMRENDSATCRSCHNREATDQYAQSEDAVKMHQFAAENKQTCIDCHKGVAHFPPELELDDKAFDQLLEKTTLTDKNAKTIYPVKATSIDDLGVIRPTAELSVLGQKDNQRQIKLSGYQMKGAEQVIYIGEGQRAIIAQLTKKGEAALETGQFKKDEYDNQWRPVSLVATLPTNAAVLDTLEPIWQYAEELDTVYCSTCHAKIPANHFTVNAWGPSAKSMGERTDISASNLEILTKYFQRNAKDIDKH